MKPSAAGATRPAAWYSLTIKEEGMSLKQWYKRRADRDSGAEDLAPAPREETFCFTAAAPSHPVPLIVVPPPPRKLTAPD